MHNDFFDKFVGIGTILYCEAYAVWPSSIVQIDGNVIICMRADELGADDCIVAGLV